MIRILASDKISEKGLKILEKEKNFKVDLKPGLSPEELKKIIKDYDALLVRSGTKVTADIINAGKKLRVIGRAGVGLDNVDVEAASKKGIIVMNSPAGNTISTAEHTVAMILSLSRNIPQSHSSLRRGEWKRSQFKGVELYGKNLGIIGLGRIGAEVARRCASFGMNIMAYDPFLSKEKAEEIGVEPVSLDTLFKKAEYITVHTPLTAETKNLISEKNFKKMQNGVRIVNCARGGIVNLDNLLKALDSGKVSGAALDVYEKEPPEFNHAIFKHEKVVTTPHLGASTEEAQENVAIEIVESLRDAILGKGIRNAANFPSMDPESLKVLQPYINLAEKLGSFVGQLSEGGIKAIHLQYCGQVINYDISALSMAAVKGVLSKIMQETVNYVNAISSAKERGIKIQESKLANDEEFNHLVTIEVKTEKGSWSVAGTLFADKLPRIVKIDNFFIEAIPEGHMIVAHNEDKPGIIGAVGTLMGKNKINIAGMTFGRDKRGGKAISALNIDSPINNEILKKFKKIKHILDAKFITI